MVSFKIKLVTIEDVRNFVTAANMQLCDADVVSDRYRVNAKSLLGIFGLDLSRPVEVQVYGTEHDAEQFKEAVKSVVVEK